MKQTIKARAENKYTKTNVLIYGIQSEYWFILDFFEEQEEKSRKLGSGYLKKNKIVIECEKS